MKEQEEDGGRKQGGAFHFNMGETKYENAISLARLSDTKPNVHPVAGKNEMGQGGKERARDGVGGTFRTEMELSRDSALRSSEH